MSRPIHLGLDVGGTASRWVACAPDGDLVGRGAAAGATGHIFNPSEKDRLLGVVGTIVEALARADLHASSVTAGITGYGDQARDAIAQLLGKSFGTPGNDIVLVDDIVLAYMANFEPGEGHLVSAGTGSIGVHVSADGESIRVGGRGILIDDAGGGSWIALRALDRLYRSLDRHGDFSSVEPLADRIFTMIGGREWHHVRQFVYGGDRGRIGTLAVAVAGAAEAGDATALAILREAGVELAQLATCLQQRVGELPIKFTGGVLDLHPVILQEVTGRLRSRDVSRATADAALAAAQLRSGRRPAWESLLI